MNLLPWRRGTGDPGNRGNTPDGDAIHFCEFQDGTIAVHEDRIRIGRSDRSKFEDKWIALNQVLEVTYERRLVISYIQIEQEGFENDEGGRLSTPVDANTLHFGRGKRECAREARDTILERMAAE